MAALASTCLLLARIFPFCRNSQSKYCSKLLSRSSRLTSSNYNFWRFPSLPVESVPQRLEPLVADAHDEDDCHGSDEAAHAVDPPEVEEDDLVEAPVEVHHHHMAAVLEVRH